MAALMAARDEAGDARGVFRAAEMSSMECTCGVTLTGRPDGAFWEMDGGFCGGRAGVGGEMGSVFRPVGEVEAGNGWNT